MQNPLMYKKPAPHKTVWHQLHAVAPYLVPAVLALVMVLFSRRPEMVNADKGKFLLLMVFMALSGTVIVGSALWLTLKVAKLNNAVTIPPREQWSNVHYFKRVENLILAVEPGDVYDLRDTPILVVPKILRLVAYKFELNPHNALEPYEMVPWRLAINFENAMPVDIERFEEMFELANTMGLHYRKVVLDPLRDAYYGKPELLECVREENFGNWSGFV